MNRDHVTKNGSISQTDARILSLLQADGRRSYAELGGGPRAWPGRRRTSGSRSSSRGASSGATRADVDPIAVGLSVLAFTWVTQAPGTISSDLTPEFAAIPEIEECHYIAGEADYILKIRARDMEHLGAIVRRVQTTEHVFSTETDVVFSTGFEGRPLPLAGAAERGRETARRRGRVRDGGAPGRRLRGRRARPGGGGRARRMPSRRSTTGTSTASTPSRSG